jgi:Zn-dependent metalloprotease
MGEAWDFYREVFGRDSIDGAGFVLIATGHYGTAFDNAFWDGDEFACGHPDIFGTMTGRTIVIHELSHGFDQFSLNFDGFGQPGALKEHVADVMAASAEQRVLGQLPTGADWLIGRECFEGTALQGRAIRALKDPPAYDDPLLGTDPTRSHMSDLYTGFEDQGGVHINCGIPSRAFYLAAMNYGLPAFETVGRIWYRVLEQGLAPQGATFQQFADATVVAALDLGLNTEQLISAWAEVGIDVGGHVPVEDPSDCEEDVLAFLREPTLRQLLRTPAGRRMGARARAFLR